MNQSWLRLPDFLNSMASHVGAPQECHRCASEHMQRLAQAVIPSEPGDVLGPDE